METTGRRIGFGGATSRRCRSKRREPDGAGKTGPARSAFVDPFGLGIMDDGVDAAVQTEGFEDFDIVLIVAIVVSGGGVDLANR